ncbi:N-acetylneuraminate synthase family protein [Terasakiella sp. SH-1]|uniref:N-acetylneuraminate synthase family protein n=1 Tax=Terasakiella sp. SH-1 TaxID=2560057 RepID=UPI00197DA027|nr:N-acetylneuraminate synthase family protein [Terasakiella sp. SH-1]
MSAHKIPMPLVVLEMANNHMGSLDHGLKLIETFGEVCKGFPFTFALKLQYRQMDTFIHPDFQDRMDLKYVKRFMETRLSREQFQQLIKKAKDCGFLTMCTPFDNESVGIIEEEGFDILKIASCSFTDWPLLERVVQTNLPIIISAAAATTEELDNVVTFLKNRDKVFALNHCVAEYPTPPEKIQLNQIDYMRNRYPGVAIGYSTHEPPSFMGSIAMAVAKGVELFERHIALPSDEFAPNAYSATPEELTDWLKGIETAMTLCGGSVDKRIEAPQEEVDSLRALRRGVFLKQDVEAGKPVSEDDVFFAIPCEEGQITANDWSKYVHYSTTQKLKENAPLMHEAVEAVHAREQVLEIVSQVNQLLQKAHVLVPVDAELEISHHYGIEKFHETGAAMITLINRQYCKKIIAVLAGQSNPEHYHKQKDETFYVLHGTLDITVEGQLHSLKEGDMLTLKQGERHSFSTQTGVVFEEVSTQHKAHDSFYSDPDIMANDQRKTHLRFWQNKISD